VIFVTVGSMLPFDRLVRVMDEWAEHHPGEKIFAQIGGGPYEPRHMPFARMISPSEFRANVQMSDFVVAHAGMGSVIMAAEAGKPIILFPRRAALGEHTTDHQLHTAKWLKGRPGIEIAMDEQQLDALIAKAQSSGADIEVLSTMAPDDFVDRIRAALTDSSARQATQK
jgi:UDP-N-acetylglucosamine transferase subunit ALG13